MSNLIPANVQIPAHLAKRIGVPSVLGQALGSGIGDGGGGFPRISIKGSRFRINEGGNETVLDSTNLDIIIVGANPRLSKTWYAKAWTPESEPSKADCYSLTGVSPHPDSTDPQNDLCASCPQNAWGSKVTPQGKEIKACADQKRLAVVAADDPEGPVYLLQVTPAALAGLGKFQKELSMRGIPAEIVRTKISFDTDASFPKLKFDFGGFIDEETQAAIDHLFGSDEVKVITGENAGESLPKLAAPAPVASKPAVRVAEPAPAVVEPAPAVATEPEPAAPKRGFGASKKVEAPAKAKPVAKAEPKVESVSIADEIEALLGDIDADDA
jgi:hypothetical protein